MTFIYTYIKKIHNNKKYKYCEKNFKVAFLPFICITRAFYIDNIVSVIMQEELNHQNHKV